MLPEFDLSLFSEYFFVLLFIIEKNLNVGIIYGNLIFIYYIQKYEQQ